MRSLQKRLQNSSKVVYDFCCGVCGGNHFRYEQEVRLGTFPFYGYTCLGCGELLFMDKSACYDILNDFPYKKAVNRTSENILGHKLHIKLDKPKNVW